MIFPRCYCCKVATACRTPFGLETVLGGHVIVLLEFKEQMFEFRVAEITLFHKISSQPFLQRTLVSEQGLDLEGTQQIQLYCLFSETSRAGPFSQDYLYIIRAEPSPAVGDITQIGTLTPLPDQSLDQGLTGDDSTVKQVETKGQSMSGKLEIVSSPVPGSWLAGRCGRFFGGLWWLVMSLLCRVRGERLPYTCFALLEKCFQEFIGLRHRAEFFGARGQDVRTCVMDQIRMGLPGPATVGGLYATGLQI